MRTRPVLHDQAEAKTYEAEAIKFCLEARGLNIPGWFADLRQIRSKQRSVSQLSFTSLARLGRNLSLKIAK